MAKTIRIDNEEIHEELIQLFLNFQAEKGQKIKMEDLIAELIKNYHKKR